MSYSSPKKRNMSDIKSRLLSPATTSNYEVFFGLPINLGSIIIGGEQSLDSYIKENQNIGLPSFGTDDQTLIHLSCTDTILPGSSFATHEIINDRTGITEKHVYRRQYDGQIDFTFMVDSNYKIIRFFELWMGYIIGQNIPSGFSPNTSNSSYRVKFPKSYQTSALHVIKFEKDHKQQLIYTFRDAFPLNFASTPISYGQSELMKVTITMSYTNYYIEYKNIFDLNLDGNIFSNTRENFISIKDAFELGQKIDLGIDYNMAKPILSPENNVDFFSGTQFTF